MQSADEKPVLKCNNVIISSRGIAEADGNKVVIFIPANEIQNITLKFGRSEYHPVVSLSIGIILTLIGLFGLFEILVATRGWRYEIAMMLLGGIGSSLIFDTLKQRFFLEIQKTVGTRRLIFSKNTPREAIKKFCDEVNAVYKYHIAEYAPGIISK